MRRRWIISAMVCCLMLTLLVGCEKTEEIATNETSETETAETMESAETEADTEDVESAVIEEEEETISDEEIAAQKIAEGLEIMYSDRTAALALFKEADEWGNPDGSFLVGYMYDWQGKNLGGQDYVEARKYYEKVKDVNPFAVISLGFNVKYGQGGEADAEKGQELLENGVGLIDETDLDSLVYADIAYHLLSSAYEELNDADKMIEYNQKAVDLNNDLALRAMGGYYLDGIGVEQDQDKGIECLEKAYELGDSGATFALGYYYYNSLDDIDKAMEWLEKGDEKSYPNASFYKGWLLFNEYGDYQNALHTFEKAANIGQSNAMFWAGYCYHYGYGTEPFYTEAETYYEMAIENGETDAQEFLDELHKDMQQEM